MHILDPEVKAMLPTDAKRLFRPDDEDEWSLSPKSRYRSNKQAARHYQRDGSAFATVSLPPKYSVIYRVLSDLRWRLGDDVRIGRVLEWGGGLGSGVWAALNAFQKEGVDNTMATSVLADSTIDMYWAFDRNRGLVEMGKRLVAGE
jgi:ribosomal protein RSM22 (predicted rRNA methylase)